MTSRAEQLPLAQTELLTDPATLGYQPFIDAGNHGELELMVNDSALGTPCDVRFIPAIRLQEAVDDNEWASVQSTDAPRLELWRDILVAGVNGIDIRDPQIRQQIGRIWNGSPATPNTLSNLLALQTEPCSRARNVTGEATYWDHIFIAEALAL